MLLRKIRLIGAISALMTVTAAWSAPADFDTTFGNGGGVSLPTGIVGPTQVEDITTGASGAIYVLANVQAPSTGPNPRFVVARFSAAGVLDATFANGGILVGPANQPFTVFGASVDESSQTAVEVGEILVTSVPQAFVSRTNFFGAFDFSFGSFGGFTLLSPPAPTQTGQSVATTVVRQADGAFLVAGTAGTPGIDVLSTFIARLNANGAIDTTFGNNGYLVFSRSVASEIDAGGVAEIVQDGAGRISLCLPRLATSSSSLLVTVPPKGLDVARASADGVADSAFGQGGIRNVAVMADAKCLALRPRVDLGYGIAAVDGSQLLIARTLPNGVLDSSFGVSGVQSGTLIGIEPVSSALVQADGKLILGHQTQDGSIRLSRVEGSNQISNSPPVPGVPVVAGNGGGGGGGSLGRAALLVLLLLAMCAKFRTIRAVATRQQGR